MIVSPALSAKPPRKSANGLPENPRKDLTSGIEIEGLVQTVMLVLRAKLQAVAALLPAQCVAGAISFLDSSVVGERIGT